ncbi:MAG: Gfo/Idh/MocA family protein [Acetivibrionales bacterium]|jgi:predicted dehydrogenase
MNNKERLTAGFIGCGSIARIKHLPAAQKTGSIDCVAFYDLSEENARRMLEMANHPDARIYASPDEIFEDANIDLVYICVPNKYHAPLAIRALDHKKHVVCEKPMACSYQDALQMHQAAVRNRRVLYIAYQNRFNDEVIYAKRLADEGALGSIYHAKAHAVRTMGIPTWGVFTNKDVQGGGALIDIGTHSIDLVLYLTNNYEPLYVCGMTYDKIAKRGSCANQWGDWDPSRMDVEDSSFAMIVMKNKMTITVDVAWAMYTTDERMSSFSLYGDQAGIEMREGLCLIKEIGGSICRATPRIAPPNSLMAPNKEMESSAVREAKAYTKAMLLNQWDTENGRNAMIVSKIIEGIYMSAEKGEPVMLAD